MSLSLEQLYFKSTIVVLFFQKKKKKDEEINITPQYLKLLNYVR